MKKKFLILSIVLVATFFQTSCSKDDDPKVPEPEPAVDLEVSTSEATEIFDSSAKLSGKVIEDNDLQVSAAYFEYRKADEDALKVIGELDNDGVFKKTVSDLLPETQYEFQAIVEFSNEEVVKGEIKTFTTLPGQSEISSVKLFVAADSGEEGDGGSWDNAYNDINTALEAAVNMIDDETEMVELWVKQGTYDFSSSSITLRNNVEIYGGFNGTETSLEDRDYENNISIFDGGGVNRVLVNEYTKEDPLNNTAILDGFTIQNGRGEGVEGGAMYNLFASPTISNCIFKDNSTSGRGGAVVSYVNLEDGETLEIDPLTFINCTFINNNASGDGGGLYANHRTHLDGGKFENNSSPWGGAAYFSKTEMYANGTEFNNNHGHNRGGAIYAQGMVNMQLTDCLLTNNYTTNEGSEFGGGAIFFDNGHNEIIRCTFDGNKTVGNGGALYPSWNGCEVLINDSEIKNNEATNGGGIYASVVSKLLIDEETVISKNTATENGGGIYEKSFDNTKTEFSFLTVSENKAKIGGGIYLFEHSYKFLNVSIKNNEATDKGDGLYLNNATVEAVSGNCFTEDSCSSEGTGNCPDFSSCE